MMHNSVVCSSVIHHTLCKYKKIVRSSAIYRTSTRQNGQSIALLRTRIHSERAINCPTTNSLGMICLNLSVLQYF